MASSSYYYSLYTQYKKSAQTYDKNIQALEKIKNSLNSDFYDEPKNVNTQLSELKDDLGKSVRHDSSFDRTLEACEQNKEKTTNADSDLNSAVSELEQEISELSRKKSEDESKRDDYYRQYKERKEEERQEWLANLKIFN